MKGIQVRRLVMKRTVILLAFCLTAILTLNAAGPDFDDLSDAQRYDLAHAYNMVADRFDELDDTERADAFRKMVQVIYPGFGEVARPVDEPETVVAPRPEKQPPDPAGENASRYYFQKLLRGVFNENVTLTTSVLADTIFLPLFDQGVDRQLAASELEWFFNEYDLTGISPQDVFKMDEITTVPLDNGYWRLDVETQSGYETAVPEVTFWAARMGFYFRKFAEGWRLAAIGPVA